MKNYLKFQKGRMQGEAEGRFQACLLTVIILMYRLIPFIVAPIVGVASVYHGSGIGFSAW
ncbi:hypothetical protein HJA76_09825 [Rhizobium bangladeshense]|uniref:hypothetical protein n=1 Tax=Rhizobium bangladeshense TaxID=1138189 RepID=UPI001C83F0F7|nr:hypothetical protein [Rhizobium bangladeshense]MBX4920006.1 hypothetical protein [Rhizobium bangladeshense]